MLMVPNMIWTRYQPDGYDNSNENKYLIFLERAGQILTTVTVLVFSDFNIKHLSLWSLWLFASLTLMTLYEFWWFHYFKSRRSLGDFYSCFLGIPLAGATLPVAAFFLLGIYGKVIWLILSVMVLGIGHIGIHLQHYREIT